MTLQIKISGPVPFQTRMYLDVKVHFEILLFNVVGDLRLWRFLDPNAVLSATSRDIICMRRYPYIHTFFFVSFRVLLQNIRHFSATDTCVCVMNRTKMQVSNSKSIKNLEPSHGVSLPEPTAGFLDKGFAGRNAMSCRGFIYRRLVTVSGYLH